MKKIVLLIALLVSAASCMANNFVKVDGPDLVKPDGSKLFIKGANLGNWLNPEGYMFSFRKTNSPRMIQDLVCQLAGTDGLPFSGSGSRTIISHVPTSTSSRRRAPTQSVCLSITSCLPLKTIWA